MVKYKSNAMAQFSIIIGTRRLPMNTNFSHNHWMKTLGECEFTNLSCGYCLLMINLLILSILKRGLNRQAIHVCINSLFLSPPPSLAADPSIFMGYWHFLMKKHKQAHANGRTNYTFCLWLLFDLRFSLAMSVDPTFPTQSSPLTFSNFNLILPPPPSLTLYYWSIRRKKKNSSTLFIRRNKVLKFWMKVLRTFTFIT